MAGSIAEATTASAALLANGLKAADRADTHENVQGVAENMEIGPLARRE
nr:hypothetical protein [Streptomyces sp. ISL-10]